MGKLSCTPNQRYTARKANAKAIPGAFSFRKLWIAEKLKRGRSILNLLPHSEKIIYPNATAENVITRIWSIRGRSLNFKKRELNIKVSAKAKIAVMKILSGSFMC